MSDRLEEIRERTKNHVATYPVCSARSNWGDASGDMRWLISALESARAELAAAKLVIQDLMTWAPNCTARDRAKTWLEEAALRKHGKE